MEIQILGTIVPKLKENLLMRLVGPTNQFQKILGDEYTVLEEGLGGRTSVFEDPLTEGLCGLSALSTVFLSLMPIDMAIIMLGTSDCY